MTASGPSFRPDRSPPAELPPRLPLGGRRVSAGEPNEAAARELGISPRTVSTHLSTLFQKLELASRAELARALMEERLLERG